MVVFSANDAAKIGGTVNGVAQSLEKKNGYGVR